MNMTTLAAALAAVLIIIGGFFAFTHYQIKPTPQKTDEFVTQVINRSGSSTTVDASPEQLVAAQGGTSASAPTSAAASPSGQTQTQAKPTISPTRMAKAGDAVFVEYTGKLQNGTVFDSSVGKKPFGFVLGAGMVIKGWDDGIVGMKVGETKTLVIPSTKAYGPDGVKDDKGNYVIPPNATLTFTVKVLDIQDYTPAQR